MTQWPPVTAVVLARDRRDKLRVTLRRLSALDYPGGQLEIIVVDNGSTDGTPAMVRDEFPAVALVANDVNVGIAGWNQGLERGRGDYFLVLDDDCYLEGDSLRRAVTVALDCQADLVSFLARSTHDGRLFNAEYDPGLLAFWGCAALLSRRAVSTLRGFDPGIFLWTHEAEFTIRLLDRGLRHLFAPEIVAHHMVEASSRLTPVFYRANTRNLAYTAAKLLRRRDALVALANLATTALLQTVARQASAGCLPAVASGAYAGWRRRTPVGARVSGLYRSNFVDFVSPLRFIRSPRVADAVARRRAFCRRRPALYPTETAWLQL